MSLDNRIRYTKKLRYAVNKKLTNKKILTKDTENINYLLIRSFWFTNITFLIDSQIFRIELNIFYLNENKLNIYLSDKNFQKIEYIFNEKNKLIKL